MGEIGGACGTQGREITNAYKLLEGKLKDPGIVGRILLKRVLKKLGEGLWTVDCGSGYGPGAGSCGHSNESSGSI
jgi:hypothetical protein